jgi:formylglycine-generating enzyme required for sulfatase activity
MSAPEDFKHNPAHTTLTFTDRAEFGGEGFHYRLLQRLASKECVWLAEDLLAKESQVRSSTRSFGQAQLSALVVIKKATFEDYSSLLRLHGEYEALKHIANSPARGRAHIQQPLRYVELNTCATQHGALSNEPFMVLPFLSNSRPLFSLCQGGAGEPLAQRYAQTLFDLLALLEERQLIHRDIAPNNLLVDETGHLWLIDFGHALHTSELNREDIQMQGGGTQGFMAPEVAAPSSGNTLTFAADQFSVARILLMLLTGALPDAFGQAQPQLNKVAADLRAVLQKATTENPEQRYANAAALCEAWAGVFAARVKTDAFQKKQESAKNTTPKQLQEPNVFAGKRGEANYSKSQYLGLLGAVMMGGLLVFWSFSEKTPREIPAHVFVEKPAATKVTNHVIEPEMVDIPAGTFDMGYLTGNGEEDELPVLKGIKIKAFRMSKYEITWDEYGAYDEMVSLAWFNTDDDRRMSIKHPVVMVGWDDVTAYAKWLSEKTGKSYRLPTEAEWEYAARAGRKSDFATGKCISTTQANYNDNYSFKDCPKMGKYIARTAEVGSYAPNAFGIYDLHGNVWEWTQDCYHDSYRNAPVTMRQVGKAWEDTKRGACDNSAHVIRGGSWDSAPVELRSASREAVQSGRNFNIGFRLVQDL